jgi:hypothetical protein
MTTDDRPSLADLQILSVLTSGPCAACNGALIMEAGGVSETTRQHERT